jgi:hypothetical protein
MIKRFQRGHLPLVIATIADGIREGSIRDDVPPLALLPVAVAVGAIPQIMLNQIAPKLPAPRGDALADLLIELLWTGIRPPTTQPPRSRAARKTSRVR